MSDKYPSKLSDELLKVISDALSQYLGADIRVKDATDPKRKDPWLYHVHTDYMFSHRGIFKNVIAKYYIDADVVQHKFEGDESYRNGKVYRIHPHIGWTHHRGGMNGHETEPRMIIIEKTMGNWHIGTELN